MYYTFRKVSHTNLHALEIPAHITVHYLPMYATSTVCHLLPNFAHIESNEVHI